MTLKLANAYPKDNKANEAHLHQHVHLEQERRLQEQLANEPVQVLRFIYQTGVYPTPAQMAYIMGDDTKWQEALADGNADPCAATEPLELVLRRSKEAKPR